MLRRPWVEAVGWDFGGVFAEIHLEEVLKQLSCDPEAEHQRPGVRRTIENRAAQLRRIRLQQGPWELHEIGVSSEAKFLDILQRFVAPRFVGQPLQIKECILQEIGEAIDETWEIARELKAKGVRMAVFSNTIPMHWDLIAHRFANELEVFDGRLYSSFELRHRKPDAEAFQLFAEQLSLAPEKIVFIDDRSENCHGAKSAGMDSILYQPRLKALPPQVWRAPVGSTNGTLVKSPAEKLRAALAHRGLLS